jgi:hypothetical protein
MREIGAIRVASFTEKKKDESTLTILLLPSPFYSIQLQYSITKFWDESEILWFRDK